MDRSLKLKESLEALGPVTVYFQPPSMDSMVFPCIVYNLDADSTVHADNLPYYRTWRYEVTIITRDANTQLKEKVADLPQCSFNRAFVIDGLYHFVFNLFF